MSGLIMKPWDERTQPQRQLMTELQPKLRGTIAGVRAVVYPLPSLPVGGSPLQIQFAMNTIEPFSFLYPYAVQMEQAAQKRRVIYDYQ